jgi:hypothetical protein
LQKLAGLQKSAYKGRANHERKTGDLNMTRKDYILISDALRVARQANGAAAHGIAIDDVALHLATRLANDNPRFDRARFLAAAGVAGNFSEDK